MRFIVQIDSWQGAPLTREVVTESLQGIIDRMQTGAAEDEILDRGTSDMVDDDYHEVTVKWRVDEPKAPNLVVLDPRAERKDG